MKTAPKIISIIALLLFILNGSASLAQDVHIDSEPKTLAELKAAIQKILRETNTPGAGVALVSGDKTIWLEGLGKADVENNIAANENTMFRLGSVSKVYVALAILKLQEEGRLTLKDKIKDIIPEIEFDNPWEDSSPIRIENLLEHTAGWSYWHYAELGSDNPKPLTLREALDVYPKSRVSTFIPGTRHQYSNVGTSVAAYIVEKVSGLSFESYVDKYFFEPMGIDNMTYLQSKQYKKTGAALYENGVRLSYFNILYRPSAALNGSPKDMAKMVEFFIHRGKVNGTQILSDSSLARMERSESMPVLSKSELYRHNGLSSYGSYYKGFLYYGHGGSVPGGNADFGYFPDYSRGYAVMINSGDEDALNEITSVVKSYQTSDLKPKPVVADSKKYKATIDPSGYYTIINPPIALVGALERIKAVHKVWFTHDTLYVKRLMVGNSTTKFTPAGNREFRSVETKRIGLVLVNDPLVGNTIGGNLKKISPLWAYTLIAMFFAFPILLVLTVVFGLLGSLVYLVGKNRSKTALWVCLWPLITSSFVIVAIITVIFTVHTRYDSFQLFGTVNPVSLLFFVCGIGYALASCWSVYYIFRNRRVRMAKFFYYYSALAAILSLLFTLYFLSNGLVGIPTWC